MNEVLPLLALFAVVTGAIVSVAQGYGNRPEGEVFRWGRFMSSLIIGVVGALGISNLAIGYINEQIAALGYVAFTIVFFLQGYATDRGLSKLDK